MLVTKGGQGRLALVLAGVGVVARRRRGAGVRGVRRGPAQQRGLGGQRRLQRAARQRELRELGRHAHGVARRHRAAALRARAAALRALRPLRALGALRAALRLRLLGSSGNYRRKLTDYAPPSRCLNWTSDGSRMAKTSYLCQF